LTLAEAEGDPLAVWPDNIAAVNTFISMGTQWRTAGMSGLPIGLDYAALPAVLRMSAIPRAQWPEIFDSIRVMEDAALQTMQRLRKK
jgi:hypothetical protein